MQGRANQLEHTAAIARVLDVTPHAAALRAHVKRIIESPAFKGSRRSQEFLQFITDRALDGHFDELKERTLGVELFGRSPSYDTGDDAIVRVTACDVRKRLAQFHAEAGYATEFRIDLLPGSYIPELRRVAPAVESLPIPISAPLAKEITPSADAPAPKPLEKAPTKGPVYTSAWAFRIVFAHVIFFTCAAVWIWNHQNSVFAHSSSRRVLPWSALIQPGRQAHVIFCDPEIVTIQRMLGFTVTLSDYANRRYWPDPASISPEAERIMQTVAFRGTSVAAVDAEIALRIASLAVASTGTEIPTQVARNVRLEDFKTEDSFILFGSPRSNPWVELFQDQLDFTFEFDKVKRSEFIRNIHRLPGESETYVPTAEGWGTGQAYAIVALVSNPNQSGTVLLLAGSNAEGTAAAGKFATNLDLLSRTLKSHGMNPNGPPVRFEVLLRVSTMAGSPNTFDVIACHVLAKKTT